MKKLKEIADIFGIKLIIITKNNLNKYIKKFNITEEDLTNNAYIIGDEELILGIYDSPDVKVASFFHEIGHTLIKERFEKLVKYDTMLIEFQAWIEGLRLAKKYGYQFSNKTYKYILDSLNSYYDDAVKVYDI